MTSTFRTSHLPQTQDYQRLNDYATLDERIAVSYRRARAIAKAYGLTAYDVQYMTPKFWELHTDNIHALDGAAFTLLTIQYNLAGGTLAPFAEKRPELRPLMDKIMKFDVSAQFMLTEVGHGLDAPNLETTATLLPNGEFDLHTPNEGARKYMPPTGPFGSIPRIAVVFARLVVNGENRGIRPFVVPLGDGKQMCKGVTSRMVPQRGGIKPVDHSVTSFDHVRLPASALLGSLAKPADLRANFISHIWRVTVGSLALATLAAPLLSVNAYVAARYSLRRTIAGPDGGRVPVMTLRTQQLPIMHAIAQAAVIKAQALAAIQMFKDTSIDYRVRSGIAAASKSTMTAHAWSSLSILTERVGAHGMFEHNNIIQSELLMRGIRIAEGDVLALSIRLANELLLGRYEMPKPKYPESLLARHEVGLFTECRNLLLKYGKSHRDENLSRLLLPRCLPLVQAIGYRLAYEAAVDAKVDKYLVDLYEAGVVMSDSGWYVEHMGLSRWAQFEMEERAVTSAMPHLEEYLERTGAAPYAVSPILTQRSWEMFLNEIPIFTGNAEVSVIVPSAPASIAAEQARL
ncbi:hypothetical protein AcV5_008933 [Taiwanofungus camphoratus]|nr:hypothetical protein AcV5_008933 [Antrodia cinnamomea]KAI0941003.1 hypothetical protein AcV7_003226 [Antrodia cinnamomea]